MSDRNYYCSMKFKYIKIDLESRTTYTCHAAKQHAVDFDWLSKHTGQLFNTDINISERHMMLLNQRNNSCEENCWSAEDIGAVSPRIHHCGMEKTHTETRLNPETIDLVIGGDCNLTCSYCCKEFSSAWRRDLVTNGDYNLNDVRYQAKIKDRALLKISQPELKTTAPYQLLLQEVALAAPSLKKLIVTGGEPFLDNSLVATLKNLQLLSSTKIEIYTGLGVSYSRLAKIAQDMACFDNLHIVISAESIGPYLEFNRYGSKWDDFKKKVTLLKEFNIKVQFHCTLSNLTIFGFTDFFKYFNKDHMTVSQVYQPSMMASHVLDPHSKQRIVDELNELPWEIRDPILKSIASQPTEQQRISIGVFLKEFVSRRPELRLDIFPQSFLKWLE